MNPGAEPKSFVAPKPPTRKRAARPATEAEATETCAVCLNPLADGSVMTPLTECAHVFHAECVGPWLDANHTCPTCRAREEGDGRDPAAARVTQTVIMFQGRTRLITTTTTTTDDDGAARAPALRRFRIFLRPTRDDEAQQMRMEIDGEAPWERPRSPPLT